jgi:phosphoglycerate dehydrogenase-like enzyme
MAAPYQVVIADFLDESEVETPILGEIATVHLARAWSEAELLTHVESADALILYHDIPALGRSTFERAPRLQGVIRAGVGFNNVDLNAANDCGVVVCNVPDYGTEEVADHAMALLLAVARQLFAGDLAIRRGEWDFRNVIEAPRLRGKTIGLLGCGRIGTAMALRAKSFGFDVVFFDPFAPPGHEKAIGVTRAETLDDLLAQSQFLSLHCYLDDSTRGLIDASALAKLPEGAVLINTARGGVVVSEAVADALDRGHLLGAGLDVFEVEPLDNERLRTHPKVVLSPHSAFYSREAFRELRRKTAEECRRLLMKQPLRCPVNEKSLRVRRST